jgi:hypothetical protein
MGRCAKCLWKMFLILLVTVLLYYTLRKAVAVRVALDNNFNYCQTAVCNVQPNNDLPIPPMLSTKAFNKDTAMFLVDGLLRVSGVLPPHPALKQIAVLTTKKQKIQEYFVYQIIDQPKTLVILLRGTRGINDFFTDLRMSQHLYGSPIKDMLQLFGTDEVAHWTLDSLDRLKTDRSLKQTMVENMQIHAGFFDLYENLREQLWSVLNEIKPTHVYMGGHSLGGAIGNIMLLDIGFNLPSLTDLRLYTFGSPRVGNLAFVVNCRNIPKVTQFYQMENTADVVPTLPLAVTPNLTNLSPPYLYDKSGQSMYFSANWGSVTLNHGLSNYALALMNL